jgi:Tfp pilus assembly protein PilN
MRVIDFLPNDYMAIRGRRRANLTCLAIAGTVCIGLALGLSLLYVHAKSMAASRVAVEQQYADANQQRDQLQALEGRKADLLRKVSLSTTLLERVPRSTILARLTNYLPRGASLTNLSMKIEDMEVRASEVVGGSDKEKKDVKDAKEAAAKNGGKPATVRVKQYVFRLDGLAPTDVEVAEYLSRLNAEVLFRNVDLQFSEELVQKEGASVRRFQLKFRLSPGAEKALESAPPTDVVAAPASDKVRGES